MSLKTLHDYFVGSPEGQWVMKRQNAHALYEFVKKHPVKRVLDLGTGIGCSAAVVALALKDKGETEYRIDSVEQFDKCIKIANELIPPELKDHITIYKSEAMVWQTDKIPHQSFSIFETLPEGDYDLIINDGPSPFMEGEHYIDLSNGTITKMLLEDKIKTGTYIAWDGRIVMLKTLERYFGDNFCLMPAVNSDLNILERKDAPVSFKDELLERMRHTTYFNEKDNFPRHLKDSHSETAAVAQGTE